MFAVIIPQAMKLRQLSQNKSLLFNKFPCQFFIFTFDFLLRVKKKIMRDKLNPYVFLFIFRVNVENRYVVIQLSDFDE